jgi:glutaredoxin
LLALAVLAVSLAANASAQPPVRASDPSDVTVSLFWSATCPHCAKAKAFLEGLSARDPTIRLRLSELGTSERIDRAFLALNARFQIEPPAVPLVLVGDTPFIGFDTDATTGAALRRAIDACRSAPCPDVAGAALAGGGAEERKAGGAAKPALPETVWLPLVGEIETRSLSLPVLTIVLGLVDGFNPCAMWVLVFLIGLLVGMRDPLRMWTLGVVFLATSAVVYLAFMAAWLNVLMLLGSLTPMRLGIGMFATVAGGYYLWQFWSHPDAACPVTSPGERQRVMTRLKEAVVQRSFLAAIAGIIVLAALVNLIELLCSAGIPAVYTQVLALSDLSGPAYAGYLLLYIGAFLIDDIIVFVTAMLTLRATGLAACYSRGSHLIGGIVLSAVGLLLLFRPQWLAFT